MEQILSLTAIRDQKATLNRAILDAQAQIADLEVAERIVRRFGHSSDGQRPSDLEIGNLLADVEQVPNAAVSSATTNGSSLTIRALLAAVLRQSESPWMASKELQARATALKGQEVPMSSVAPTLSVMKKSGLIARDGFRVALVERLKETGMPNGTAVGTPDVGLAYQANPSINP